MAAPHRHTDHRHSRGGDSRRDVSSSEKVFYGSSEITKYLLIGLSVQDPSEYNLTLKLKNRLDALKDLPHSEIQRLLSDQSAGTLGEIFRALGRTQYNNVMALGPAGVGKSHLTDQLALFFSYGIMNPAIESQIGPYELLRHELIGNTEVVLVNIHLLSQDPTTSGKAFASESVRMTNVLHGLFDAAKREFLKPGFDGLPSRRRTLFLFDEVATLPPVVQTTLKKILDSSGFRNPADPLLAGLDPGYMVMGMTTPNEFRDMIRGDSAIERRYVKVLLKEPTEEEAFKILRAKSDLEWTPLYGLEMSDEAIRFVIRMRKFIDTPPLAMPANVIGAVNDLYLSAQQDGLGRIELRDAQEFLMNKLGLTDIWFTGPKGEPPFHGFAARVKKLVIGQDEVVDKITDRIAAWARLGFGGDLPVFFLGGASGSGKDTLLKALNEVMFGHDGKHLIFSIGGVGGFGIESIIEGPPLGNHSDNAQGLLVQALENGPSTGLLAFNEAKDAPTDQLEKLKVFIEHGEIRPKGKDSRPRPLKFPVFIMGQWGEEIFEGKNDAEIDQLYRRLTQAEIEKHFLAGKTADRTTGAVSRAILDRAKKTGGVFLLRPVPKELMPEIVKISVESAAKRFRTGSGFDVKVSPDLIHYIAETSIAAGEGPRGLGATTTDFTETAISRAIDLGLLIRGTAIELDVVRGKPGQEDMILVGSGTQTWPIPALELRRIKICERELTSE